MASIGYIHGVLTLSTRQFEKGLADAQNLTRRFQFTASDAFRAAATGVTIFTAAVTATAAALVYGTAKAAEWGGEIDALAKRFNLTTDAIQELQYAASQSSVEFDVLARAMLSFQRTTGGEATAAGLLAQLRAIQALPTAAARAAAAYEAFGKAYVDLLPLINGGTEALDKFQAALDKRGDALVSEQAVANLSSLNDTLSSMADSMRALVNEMLGRFAPAIERVAMALETVFVNVRQNLDNISATIRGALSLVDVVLAREQRIEFARAGEGKAAAPLVPLAARMALSEVSSALAGQSSFFAPNPNARPFAPDADQRVDSNGRPIATIDATRAPAEIGRIINGVLGGTIKAEGDADRALMRENNQALKTIADLLRKQDAKIVEFNIPGF